MPNQKDFTKTISLIAGYEQQIKIIQRQIAVPLKGITENFPIFKAGEVINLQEPESVYEITKVDFDQEAPKPKQKGRVVSVQVMYTPGKLGSEWFWHVTFELLNMKGKPYQTPRIEHAMYCFDPRTPFSK